MRRSNRVGSDGPAVAVIEERNIDFLAAQVEHVADFGPKSCLDKDTREFAHFAPEDAHRPVFDVKIVVLDVREDGAGQAEFAFKGSLGLIVRQEGGVLERHTVTFSGDLGGGSVYLMPRLEPRHVIANKAERNVQVIEPDFIGAVKTVAGREVEPRVFCSLPRLEPFRTVRVCSNRGECRLNTARIQRIREAQFNGEFGEPLEFIVGFEQIQIHTLNHFGNRLIWNVRKSFFAKAEEIQVRDITQIQEFKVVLPSLVTEFDGTVVIDGQVKRVIQTLTARDRLERDNLRQWFELERLEPINHTLDFLVPILEQAAPVLKVVPGTLEELWHAGRNILGRYTNRAHVAVAVVNPKLDAVRGWNQQVARVVLPQAFDRKFDTNRVERPEDIRPVLRITKPEFGFLDFLAVLAEGQPVRVEFLPALRSVRRRVLVGAFETFADCGHTCLLFDARAVGECW